MWKVWLSEKLKYGENAHRVEIAISEWYGVYLVMQNLGIEGTVRASFGMYNTKEEVDALVAGIERVRKMF